jgi:hypothetical protein
MKKFYLLLLAVTAMLSSISGNAQVNHLVISQVYGAGGNSGATYNRDYIELFNPTNTAISLSGYSVQYGSATGTTWQATNLTGSVAAGGYFLVYGASGSVGVAPPAGDVIGTMNLSGTTGKVALVSSTTLLSGACPTGGNIVDLVGYGSAPNCKEGATSAPTPSITNAIFRNNNGCTDTDNNGADFTAAPAAPRNSTSPAYPCNCTAPTNQPTNLSLTPSDVSIAGSFTPADPGTTAANGYLVLRSTSATLTQQPVSGTSYTAGNTLGNATVVSSGSSTTFNTTGLTPSTTYYFFVYSFATTGTCYNTTSPLTNSVTTNAATSSTVSVTAGNAAAEPSTGGNFTINFSPATTGSTDINFNFDGTAVFATDYSISFSAGTTTSTTASGTLTVPSGTSSITVTITPADDAVVEPTENIRLTLSNPTNGYTLGTSSSASINLTDNDVAPTASVAAGTPAAEPATNGTFTITLSAAAPSGGVTVNYTLGGTATAAADYTDAFGGTITIPQGSTTGTVTLTVTDDATVEATETITITLNSVNNGYTLGTSGASINLTDNDVTPLSPVALNGTYTQDFNTLATTGTTNPMTLAGWAISEAGGGGRDNEQYAGDNGSSGTGDTYSYGTTSDRALGSIASGTLQSSFGVYLANSTGATINRLKVSFMAEEWRLGTAGRTDRLDFQYSTDATSLTNGTWTNVDQLDVVTPNTVTTGQKDGNDPANRTLVSYIISGVSVPNGSTVFLRWNDPDISGTDDGLAIDSLSVEANPLDVTAPVVSSFSPADNSSGVALSSTATVTFSEAIQKGTGTITVTRNSNSTVVQTLDVATGPVTISGSTASFTLSGLVPNELYSIQIVGTAFEDLSGNDFTGIADTSTWSFNTGSALYVADFQNCSSLLSDGFTQYSVTGSITWGCTTFGRDPAAPAGTTSYPYGVQINGFSGGTNVPNVDWLISPSINLSGTAYPLLSFWSRTAFNGLPLQLKVSTNYTGGDPASATWVDVNGKFPAQTSNTWTLSQNINLSAFKQPNVHFAFVYESSNDDGARWTLDDIRIDNSLTPPPASITTSTNDLQYTFVAAGSTSNKTFSFTGNDITSDVTLTATGNFLLSKDGVTFRNSITYTQAEANNVAKTVTVRFAPPAANQNSTGTVSINTSGLTSTVNLKGTSIDPVNTLEVVNWNIEWFGSTGYGPTNEAQQEQNVRTILQNIGADIFGLIEIVDETKLAAVVSQMPGYSYVIGNFGSHVNPPDPSGDPVSQAQKMAFVYKTSQFSNVTSRPLINNQNISSTSYYNWSSGRYPFLMNADVTLNGQTRNINFILVHAKANTSPTNTSYARREAAATELHDTLMTYFPTANVIVLGDFNDDLDQSITAGFTTTSWHSFTNDGANFYSPTLPLSLAGKKSTVSYNDIIDHVIISNDMQQYYMGSTASILTDVSSLVSNYGSTTSDHYPVFTRFAFDPAIVLPVKLVKFTASKQGSAVVVNWSTSAEVGAREFFVERSADGRTFVKIGRVAAAGTTRSVTDYSFTDRQPLGGNSFYRLQVVDQDNKAEVSRVVRINLGQHFTVSLSPNPAKGQLLVSLANTGEVGQLQILDITGKSVHTARITTQNQTIDIHNLSAGLYLVRVQGSQGVYTEKLVIE